MNTIVKSKPPVWFWVFSVIALLWNLMGVGAYLGEVYMKDEMMADYTAAQKEILINQPAWSTGAFAIAVFAGALGCVALLLRKKWARPLFIVSLLAVLARTIYFFFITDATEVFSALEGIVLPILTLVISFLLVILTRIGIDRNWLT